MMRTIVMVGWALLAVACTDTVPKADYDKLRADLEAASARAAAAERELEEFRTSPAQLLADAKAALDGGQYARARASAEKLIQRHPSHPSLAEATKIKAEAERQEREATERKQALETQQVEAEKKKIAAALKSMRVEKDDVRGIEFYSHKEAAKFLNSRSEVALYFAAKAGRAQTLRLRIQYVAENWLFIEHYTIKADDRVFEIEPARGELNRDNGSGDIWEWLDVSVGAKEQSIIDAILAAKTVTVRHQGKQYYKDRVLPAAEIDRMRQVQAAFNALLAPG